MLYGHIFMLFIHVTMSNDLYDGMGTKIYTNYRAKIILKQVPNLPPQPTPKTIIATITAVTAAIKNSIWLAFLLLLLFKIQKENYGKA